FLTALHSINQGENIFSHRLTFCFFHVQPFFIQQSERRSKILVMHQFSRSKSSAFVGNSSSELDILLAPTTPRLQAQHL
ncbi:hypothetical protein JTE90_017893, partial [Oedothorax gibbosus]